MTPSDRAAPSGRLAAGASPTGARRPESAHTVPRDALIRRLRDLDDSVRLVLLVAPAGYGKTTTVREFVSTVSSSIAWVTLTRDLGTLARLLEELARTLPGRAAGEMSAALGAAAEDAPVESVAQLLASSVADVDAPVTIVLDDLHFLRTRAGLDLVVALARGLPSSSRIVAMGDRRPRLHLGRLRCEQGCLEIGPGDLAFSEDEAAELVRHAGLDLNRQAVHELVQRTEGWATGLQLASRALVAGPDPAAGLAEIDGSHGSIADFFRSEVLAHLSVETVRFLMRTAVLDRMCASLCDAVLGMSGSAVWLEEVSALGLFVAPEDERGEWFRYHRLFQDMLRAELRHREPGEDLHILREAARWYDDHGAHEQAVAHAVAGQDRFLTARLIVAHGQTIDCAGLRMFRRWLEGFGEDLFDDYPPLAVVASWIAASTGDPARARRALLAAERLSFDGPLLNGSASYDAAVAGLRAILAPDGINHMLADAERAARLEPPGSQWHPVAALMLGMAKWFTGSPEDAALAFEQAARFGRDQRRPGAACALGEHALMAAADGDWTRAYACAEQAHSLTSVGGLSGHISSLPVYAASARVALHRGDTQRAWHELREAWRLYHDPSPVALPWMAVQVAAVLGEVFNGLGNVAAAENMLRESRQHLALLPTKGILPAAVDDLATLVAGNARREEVEGATGLTRAELRVLELLPTHYTLNEIGDELGVSRNTIKTHVAAIHRKLDATSRAEAVRHAQHVGLL
jgi:LuxR family maltose regulon positive regulatory protein